MAKWLNKYPNSTGYESETEARNALGKTVSLVLNPRTLHYDKGNSGGVLPAYTVRLKYVAGYDPHSHFGNDTTLTQVSSTPNVWDATKVQNVTNMEGWIGGNAADNNLLEVIAANTTGVTSMALMFQNCQALTTVPRFDTSSCTTTQYMFLACNQLMSSPLFDTSSVTNMEGMFQSCLSLTAVPLLSTASCTDMDDMFKNCYNVESGALALYQQASEQANVPSHTDTFSQCGEETVGGAAELAQIPTTWGGTYSPVGPYNPLNLPAYTMRVRYQDGVNPGDYFGYGVTYEQVVGAQGNVWDITKHDDPEHAAPGYSGLATDWSWLFSDTESSENVQPIVEVLGANTTGVTDMTGLFAYCETLTSVALFDTSSVTNMASMFDGTGISTVPLFDTSSCTNMNGTFSNCENLTSIPLLDTSHVVNMSYMFYFESWISSSLETIPLLDTSSCTDMSGMFWNCTNVQSGALALYQQASAQNPVPSHSSTFEECGSETVTGAAELAQIPAEWK